LRQLSVGIVQSARSVIGVELSSDAVEDAKTNARINGEYFVIDSLAVLSERVRQ